MIASGMPDTLSPGEVDRVARLARLSLTDEERSLFARQLTRVLDAARQIAEVDTRGVAPMARVGEGPTGERDDCPTPSLSRDEALRNAPESLAGLFVVPRAIGHE